MVRFLLFFLILADFSYATESRSTVASNWDKPWMNGEFELKASHIKPLWDLANNYPETRQLVEQAAILFQIKNKPENLVKWIRVCNSSETDSGTRGITLELMTFNWIAKIPFIDASEDQQRAKFEQTAKSKAEKNNLEIVALKSHNGYFSAQFLERTPICIDRNASVLEAYGIFIHELTHRVRTKLEINISNFHKLNPSVESYTLQKIKAPGGEMDAFETQIRAIILAAGYPQLEKSSLSRLAKFFDEKGNLQNRDNFMNTLLQNFKYAKELETTYVNTILFTYNAVIALSNHLIETYNLNLSLNQNPQYHPWLIALADLIQQQKTILDDIRTSIQRQNLPLKLSTSPRA